MHLSLRRLPLLSLALFLVALAALGCGEERPRPTVVRAERMAGASPPRPRPVEPPQHLSVRPVMVDVFGYATFLQLIEAAGLEEVLDATGPFTVFAPNVLAFRRADYELLASLRRPEQVYRLRRMVLAHIVPGEYVVADLFTMHHAELRTLAGTTLRIYGIDGSVHVGHRHTAKIISGDMLARNGVVHLINRVFVEAVIEPKDGTTPPPDPPPAPSSPPQASSTSRRTLDEGD